MAEERTTSVGLLGEVLAEARQLGFLGPGPVEAHLVHSGAYSALWAKCAPSPPRRVLDLGSGGGVPGLPLALLWTDSGFTLLDSNRRRCAFLERAVLRLDLAGRVQVREGRAEQLARTSLRGSFDLVVARGFATPPITAECGAPFLHPGGHLLVSEPPRLRPDPGTWDRRLTPDDSEVARGSEARWPVQGLRSLGLALAGSVEIPVSVRAFLLTSAPSERFPRRTGLPAKRPLWDSSPSSTSVGS
jgi:16S rRNA (guanine527-N7)-methyltransferase